MKTFEQIIEDKFNNGEKEIIFFFDFRNNPVDESLFNNNLFALNFEDFDINRLFYEDYQNELEKFDMYINQPAFFYFKNRKEVDIIEIIDYKK